MAAPYEGIARSFCRSRHGNPDSAFRGARLLEGRAFTGYDPLGEGCGQRLDKPETVTTRSIPMSTETIVTNKATRRGDTRPGLFTERPGGIWDLEPAHPVLGARVIAHLALPGDNDQDHLPAEVAVFAATPEGDIHPDFDGFEFMVSGETELARRIGVDTEVAAFGVLGYEVVA